MSRRMYRQMAQARASLNHAHASDFSEAVDREIEDGARRALVAEEAIRNPTRVRHPIVRPTHSRWYRVIRLLRGVDNYLVIETIGEYPQIGSASALARAEQGHARVLDANGKVVSMNGQPIERWTEPAAENPREKGDDDGVEYGHPADRLAGRE